MLGIKCMRKETHIAFALMISSLIGLYEIKVNYDYLRVILHIFVCGLGGILPDFDIKFKHRVLLHNIWVLSLLAFSLWYIFRTIDPFIPVYVIAGYVSHMLLDSLTIRGVKWFYPLGYMSGPVITNSFKDKLLGIISFVVAVLAFSYITYVFIVEKEILPNLIFTFPNLSPDTLTFILSIPISFSILLFILSILKIIKT